MENQVFLTIFGAVLTAVFGAIGWKIKTRLDDQKKHLDDVSDLRKAVWRLNKTVVIMAKILDSISKKTHPELQTELEEIARELLSTSDDYEEDA